MAKIHRMFWNESEHQQMFDAVYRDIKHQLPLRHQEERMKVITDAYKRLQTTIIDPDRQRPNFKLSSERLNDIYLRMQHRRHNEYRRGSNGEAPGLSAHEQAMRIMARKATKTTKGKKLLPVPYDPTVPTMPTVDKLVDVITERVLTTIYRQLTQK